MAFCGKRSADPFAPPIRLALEFLTELFTSGIGYSAINTARSALSCVACTPMGKPIGQHPMVVRLLKGVFQERPALPRNLVTWDPSVVLDYLKTMDEAKDLPLKDLSLKLVTLIALTTGQRAQTIHMLNLTNRRIVNDTHYFSIGQKLKQTRPGSHLPEVKLIPYAKNVKLCVVTHLQVYESKTKNLRGGETGLLVSYMRPHKRIAKDTVSRWIKTMLTRAGVNMKIFTPHSTRAAAVSKAKRCAVPIGTILKTAGWSRSCTFARFYDKPVDETNQFAASILENS